MKSDCNKFNAKNILLCIMYILIGALGIALFLDNTLRAVLRNDIISNSPAKKVFVGENIVGGWANLSFFTYHTVLAFSFWSVLFGLTKIFKLDKLKNFLTKDTVVTFLLLNYILTSSLFTGFELILKNYTFDFCTSGYGLHAFGTNMLVHYVLSVVAIVMLTKAKKTRGNYKIAFWFVSAYLITYYVTVKITGALVYPVKWYPYIIFDAVEFGKLFGISNYPVAVTILVIANVLIFLAYFTLFFLILKGFRKKTIKDADKKMLV